MLIVSHILKPQLLSAECKRWGVKVFKELQEEKEDKK